VEPSPQTAALYERIQSGEETPAAGSGPPHNLPAQLTPFIGREGLLREIEERLRELNCRLLTLVGPGGSGKTRLALEAARRQLDAYPDGVYFVSLAPLHSPEAIAPAIAQAIGFSLSGSVAPKEQLVHYLRRKEMLLVLDNYEHLLAGAELASELLRAAPKVRVLATSRSGLHVQGEHRFPVPGMRYPALTPPAGDGRGERVEAALQYSAVRLFTAQAQRARPDFELDDESVEAVSRICQLVEGLPLAVVLAARWIEMAGGGAGGEVDRDAHAGRGGRRNRRRDLGPGRGPHDRQGPRPPGGGPARCAGAAAQHAGRL
jgi:hypothetical protein